MILVQVPVHVTDRRGEPIRNLDASDFRLWDEGEERTLERVEVIDHAQIVSSAVTADPNPPADSMAADDLPAAARRKLLLLFDLSFARPASVVKARAAALDFVLHELAPGDLVAVATISAEQGARLLVTFTTDRAQLARAVDTLGQPGLTGPASGDPLRFVLERPSSNPAASHDPGTRGQFDRILEEQLDLFRRQRRRVEQSFERGRISDWTRSLAALAGSLGELQGDKHVVVFSEGFDSSLIFGRDVSAPATDGRADQARREQGAYWLVDPDDTFGNSTLQADVTDMARIFTRAGARLHSVDVGGLRSGARADEEAATDAAHRGGRDSLFWLADSTGGELLHDANDLSAGLKRLLHRSSVTYLLSFYPGELAEDGAFRRLRVEVGALPRGGRVHHREGYFAPRPFADLPPLERALLTSETLTAPQPKEELAVSLLSAAFRAGENASYVPIILEVAGASWLRRPADTPDELQLEVYIYASDRSGEIADFATQQLRTTRPILRQHRGIKFYGHLRLSPGRHRLRVLVRDPGDGRTTVLSHTLDVPDWQNGPSLLSPFAVQNGAPDDRSWLMVRQDTNRAVAGEGQVVYPFLLGGEPFVPMAAPGVRDGESMRVAVIGYELDSETTDGWTTTIFGDDGVAHTTDALEDLQLLPTRVDRQTQLAGWLAAGGLRPGNYFLEVRSPDGVASSMNFRVLP